MPPLTDDEAVVMVAPLAVVAVEEPALALVPTLLLAVPRTALLPLAKVPVDTDPDTRA